FHRFPRLQTPIFLSSTVLFPFPQLSVQPIMASVSFFFHRSVPVSSALRPANHGVSFIFSILPSSPPLSLLLLPLLNNSLITMLHSIPKHVLTPSLQNPPKRPPNSSLTPLLPLPITPLPTCLVTTPFLLPPLPLSGTTSGFFSSFLSLKPSPRRSPYLPT